MNIYFHIGTEKTGSSHLQSIAAINRKRLRDEGIWFPEAEKYERQLLEGEISAGNAEDITAALNAGDYVACEEIIGKHLKKAKENGCQSLLLSNELLMLALAKENRLEQMGSAIDRHGSHTVQYLLFLRDPVDQALSLYKHRAKSGLVNKIKEWPQRHYYYGAGILSFLKEAKHREIALTCRKFSKKSGALDEILFHDWLGLEIELAVPPKKVNPSLSLSELLLLGKVRRQHPILADILYKKLLAISKDQKAEDTDIEHFHREVLSNYLTRYDKTWTVCNTFLSEPEKISYPTKVGTKWRNEKISTFSDVQMDEISGIIADSLSFRTKFRVELLKLKRRIVGLKNRLLN